MLRRQIKASRFGCIRVVIIMQRSFSMTLPLMPKATAVWLVENTALTFKQIAEFCGMHELEVEGIANEEVATGIVGKDPTALHQLTLEEIHRCEQEPSSSLRMTEGAELFLRAEKKKKKAAYTPVARRKDKPDAIAWIIKNCPEATDMQITKLIGTTKKTIEAVRAKTHWNRGNITPHDPVLLGLCTQGELDTMIFKAKEAAERRGDTVKKTPDSDESAA